MNSYISHHNSRNQRPNGYVTSPTDKSQPTGYITNASRADHPGSCIDADTEHAVEEHVALSRQS